MKVGIKSYPVYSAITKKLNGKIKTMTPGKLQHHRRTKVTSLHQDKLHAPETAPQTT